MECLSEASMLLGNICSSSKTLNTRKIDSFWDTLTLLLQKDHLAKLQVVKSSTDSTPHQMMLTKVVTTAHFFVRIHRLPT